MYVVLVDGGSLDVVGWMCYLCGCLLEFMVLGMWVLMLVILFICNGKVDEVVLVVVCVVGGVVDIVVLVGGVDEIEWLVL